ncbi:unnamed protein product [Musa textilis]
MDFTTKHLKNLMEEGSLEPRFREHVAHALELPLNWRMQRIHNRWFIETYQREATMNPLLLELAKLDFNLLPGYMKLCFLVVFDMANDAGYRVTKEKGLDIIPYLKRSAELARGDVPKSIQCCMYERNVSEDVARENVRELIRADWRPLNGDRTSSSPLEEYFKSVAINIPRMAQLLYEYGDGYGIPDGETKNQVKLLFIQSIKL